jgi:hypothetical protein
MAEVLDSAPAMNAVMDAAVGAFANVFDMELRDGGRTAAPRAWMPAAAL